MSPACVTFNALIPSGRFGFPVGGFSAIFFWFSPPPPGRGCSRYSSFGQAVMMLRAKRAVRIKVSRRMVFSVRYVQQWVVNWPPSGGGGDVALIVHDANGGLLLVTPPL